MPAQHGQVRLLSTHDIPAIERLLHTSEYIYQRFTLDELPLLLRHAPAAGLFNGASLHGFLLSQTLNPPSAWIGGFGVSWTESRAYLKILHTLLDHLSARLLTRGIWQLHYSGNDQNRDWLRNILLTQGFAPYRYLYAYDKFDFSIPTNGNQRVKVRPVRLNAPEGKSDMAA